MIIRAKRKTNFTIISNVGMEDERLSFKARGVLAYVLTKPDHWQVNERHLATVGPDGVTLVRAALKELETYGYLQRVRQRGDNGKFTWVSIVYDEPCLGNPRMEKPCLEKPRVDKPCMEKPCVDNPTLVSTEEASTEERKTKKESGSSAAAPQARTPTPHQQFFEAVCWIVGWDYKTLTKDDSGRVAQTVGILQKAEYTLDDLRRFFLEIWAEDWRWKKEKQRPTLTQLRQEIGKLRAGIPVDMPVNGRSQPTGGAAVAALRQRLEKEQLDGHA